MTDSPLLSHEALAAALGKVDRALDVTEHDDNLILAAARERLAQMAEPCRTCGGDGMVEVPCSDRPGHNHSCTVAHYGTCPTCLGKGYLYPPALVERIADELHHGEQDLVEFLTLAQARLVTVAVLDALNDGEIR